MWQCLHNNIGVGECLVERYLSEYDIYPLCQKELETILHRLRDCEALKNTWSRLGIILNINFYKGNLHCWLEKNCKDNACRLNNQPPWRIIFPFAICLLWKHRNNVVFGDFHTQSNVHNDTLFSALEFQHCVLNPKHSGNRKMVRIRWEKPQLVWVHLNTDGLTSGNPGRVGCGGIIRNDHGDWIGRFSSSIGFTTSFIAELWALRDRLTLCNNLHFNAVDIEIHAKAIVDLLTNPLYTNQFAMPIVDDCRQLISQIAQVRIGHCFREANSCTDLLARKGTLQNRDFILYHDPPVDLLELISSDKSGLYYNRLMNLLSPLSVLLMQFPFYQKKKNYRGGRIRP